MVGQLCEICYEKPAVASCKLCGRAVCKDHIGDDGICAVCKETLCQVCGRRLAIGYCVVCGRLGCDECLIQMDNVRRICKECLARLGGRERAVKSLRRLSLRVAEGVHNR